MSLHLLTKLGRIGQPHDRHDRVPTPARHLFRLGELVESIRNSASRRIGIITRRMLPLTRVRLCPEVDTTQRHDADESTIRHMALESFAGDGLTRCQPSNFSVELTLFPNLDLNVNGDADSACAAVRLRGSFSKQGAAKGRHRTRDLNFQTFFDGRRDRQVLLVHNSVSRVLFSTSLAALTIVHHPNREY